MATTIAVRFPLGRVHAAPWDRSANSGVVEWPPSPWRLLRSLVSVWYTRWPDLPATEIDGLLAALGAPNAYFTPPTRSGSTRHYMPDRLHATASTGSTDLVIDSFLVIDPEDELLIRWDTDLTVAQREVLAKLVELLPYLGRSESICEARLSESNPEPDDTWWHREPTSEVGRQVELLAPDGQAHRVALELSTSAVRKAGFLLPTGSRFTTYGQPRAPQVDQREDRSTSIQALRFTLRGRVPVRARNFVLATDAFHQAVGRALPDQDPRAAILLGQPGAVIAGGRHDHLHVVPILEENLSPFSTVVGLIAYAAAGIPTDFAGVIEHRIRRVRVRDQLSSGMAEQAVLVNSSGTTSDVASELSSPAQVWESRTPYLPARTFQKRAHGDLRFVSDDVRRECLYRGLPLPRVELLDARASAVYRRYRIGETARHQRRAFGVRITFDEPTAGPILLGKLSHFGFGLFRPITS
jgi:CRISPR-associated protein Csb2